MKKLREIRTKIDAYIQTHKPAAFIMWLLVLLFPLWLSLSGNAISFLSGEDGAAVLLCTLLTENYGAFLLGMLLIYLFFGAMVCLWKHVPLAALLTGLIFTIMPTVDFLKTEILKEHFLPWDMLLAKNADSFTTFLSALKIPTPLWWLWGGTVALHHERHRTSRLQPAGAFLRGTDRSDKKLHRKRLSDRFCAKPFFLKHG